MADSGYGNPCELCGGSGGTITIESTGGGWIVLHDACLRDVGADWALKRLEESERENKEIAHA